MQRHEPRPPSQRVGATLGLLLSVAVHAALFAAFSAAGTLPSLGIELQLPSEVEFGLTESVTTAPHRPPGPQADEQPEPLPVSQATVVKEVVDKRLADLDGPDGERDKTEADGGRDKAERRAAKDAERPDAAAAADEPSDAGTPVLAAYAPPGAQLALRIDMKRTRASPLAEDVRKVLAAMPDWQLLLEGSGIDPMEDLDRLFVASPDLKRAHLVVAGEHRGGDDLVPRAVADLAAARGKTAEWTRQDGIAVAPWHNLDETQRIIALVGPQLFAITRPEDLPRVLAVARGLAKRRAEEDDSNRAPPNGLDADADALLAMQEGETWSLSVEGAREFVRGSPEGVPSRLTVSVGETEKGTIRATATGHFDSTEQAEAAHRFWERTRQRLAAHPLLLLTGMGQPLEIAVLERQDTRLEGRTELTLQQMRVVIGFIQGGLTRPEYTTQRSPKTLRQGVVDHLRSLDKTRASPGGSRDDTTRPESHPPAQGPEPAKSP